MDIRSIVIEKSDEPTEEEFVYLMGKTENLLNEYALTHSKLYKLSPKEVEELSLGIIQSACVHTSFDPKKIYLVGTQQFPDIIASEHYGVEVKCTQKNHWTSTGSSIIESTRVKSVKRIYMLFAKLGGSHAQFRCRPYEDVLAGITVTHSPRYLIDMSLKQGDSIFDKMGTTYDELRKSSDAISKVRSHYRAKMNTLQEMPWWLADEVTDGQVTAGISLRTWDALGLEEKERMFMLLLLLFPKEIIQKEYRKIALFSATTISLLLYNARDFFSAGGMGKYLKSSNGLIENLPFRIPHTYIHLINKANCLKDTLCKPDFWMQVHPFVEDVNPKLISRGTYPTDMYDQWVEQVASLLPDIPFKAWIQEGKEVLV